MSAKNPNTPKNYNKAVEMGEAAFYNDAPRQVPMDVLCPDGKNSTKQSLHNSMGWYRGWDRANALEMNASNCEAML